MKTKNRTVLILLISTIAASFSLIHSSYADDPSAGELFKESKVHFNEGQYFKSARYAFSANQEISGSSGIAYSHITQGLMHAGLYNSAVYFFIKALKSENSHALRRVLPYTEELIFHVGVDIIKRYLIRHTKASDYDAKNKAAYLYALGKDALLKGYELKAVAYFDEIPSSSSLWPFSLQLKATANAILGRNQSAIDDFSKCTNKSGSMESRLEDMYSNRNQVSSSWVNNRLRELEDLKSRCQAGVARTLYQVGRHDDADKAYDKIPKESIVWPDILFEQAWNSFARQEYNRSLGKLITYHSPLLGFIFNSEVEVLMAQSYLTLCQYADAKKVINKFHDKYTRLGEQVKRFVERNSNSLGTFYSEGKQALYSSQNSRSDFQRLMNRFVTSPYFRSLVEAEREIDNEIRMVSSFAERQVGVSSNMNKGFPGFLNVVLKWRKRTIVLLGGAFVKNSLIDHHSVLISDYEKMSFINLELLKRAKEELLSEGSEKDDRSRGNKTPERRDDQYYWSFNGEFWMDEIGDYVFALESKCGS